MWMLTPELIPTLLALAALSLISSTVATQTVLEVWHIVLIVIGISILAFGNVFLTIIATAFIARGTACGEQIQVQVWTLLVG